MKFGKFAKNAMLAICLCTAPVMTICLAETAEADNFDHDAKLTPLFSAPLVNVPGDRLTALLVTYPPGGASPPHHHGGNVFAYVLSGVIRSENSATGPAQNYSKGQSFFEPAGSEHMISANASSTQSAQLLVIFVAADDAKLTTYDKSSASN